MNSIIWSVVSESTARCPPQLYRFLRDGRPILLNKVNTIHNYISVGLDTEVFFVAENWLCRV